MDPQELKDRTEAFALPVLRCAHSLPRSRATDILAKQLMRAATSVGANYRAACRARSKADFVSKITIVEEEADESAYWLELIATHANADKQETGALIEEAHQLTAIFTASGRTATRNR